ncbi:MAG TPA: hypothetical protein VFZ10_07235 [Geminicoccaceae bacterium]
MGQLGLAPAVFQIVAVALVAVTLFWLGGTGAEYWHSPCTCT